MKKTSEYTSRLFTAALFCLFILASAAPALAHFPWLNAADYTLPTGSAPDLTVGWGHSYPFSPFLKKDRIETLILTGPAKSTPNVMFESDIEISTDGSLTVPGAYIVSMTRKPGFHTKTAQGYKSSSKKGLDHVISCSYSHMAAKAILNVGEGKGAVDKPSGHLLEIIPLTNPVDIKAGDRMPVKVLYKGEPWSGMIFATYAGFSTDKETFAYATKTDKKGRAAIKMLNPGVWLFKVSHEESFEDPATCDLEKYTASLTFEIQ